MIAACWGQGLANFDEYFCETHYHPPQEGDMVRALEAKVI